MNIKSLLLGSAAALAAVSGAQAADAIVAAEPEPMEYVRVCDAFGTGYFYIPGTETCLKIHGYVRYDARGGDALGLDTDGDGDGDAWDKRTRFTLRTSTAADTELGALKTFTEVRFNYRNNVTQTVLKFAYIDLAGFRVGKDESSFITYLDYAGKIANDDLIPFGNYDVNLISYTYDAGNGFSALVALEDDNGAGDGYMPNVVAGLGYKTDAFSARIVGAYDEAAEDGALKARVDGKFGDASVFAMFGYNTGDVKNFYANWNGDWALWVGGTYKFNSKISTNAQVSYTESEDFVAVANVAFTVVPGFAITPEVVYKDNFDDSNNNDGQWGGMVRFQRSF